MIRLLAYIAILLVSVYALSPFIVLGSQIIGGRLPITYRYDVVGAEGPGKVRIAVTIGYLGEVPIKDYSLRVEPYCYNCTPLVKSGDVLSPGNTVQFELDISPEVRGARLEFAGSLAGFYRFKLAYNLTGG